MDEAQRPPGHHPIGYALGSREPVDAAERRTEGMRREEQHPLRQLAVFRLLADEDAASLIAVAQRHSYARGAPIADHPGTISVIAHGGVRFYCLSPTRRALTILTLQVGEFYEFTALDPQAQPWGWAEALSDHTVIYSFPGSQVLHLITAYPQLALLALMSLRRHLAVVCAQVKSLALDDVPTRLAQALRHLAATNPERRVELTHQHLAELIGTTREEVTRGLAELHARGSIDVRPHCRGIVVCDQESLTAG